jgi:hypothetical protein
MCYFTDACACPCLCALGPLLTSMSQEIPTCLQRHNKNYLSVTGMAADQIKVPPPVVWDEKVQNWLLAWVIKEF